MDRRQHWERVYREKSAQEVSWYQAQPVSSLAMIHDAAAGARPSLIDIGGGASTLVDSLLGEGYPDLAVLDISGRALEVARARLGEQARLVTWIEADVTEFEPQRTWTIWSSFTRSSTHSRALRRAMASRTTSLPSARASLVTGVVTKLTPVVSSMMAMMSD